RAQSPPRTLVPTCTRPALRGPRDRALLPGLRRAAASGAIGGPLASTLSPLRLDLLREPGAGRGGGDRVPRPRAAHAPRAAAVSGHLGRPRRPPRRRRDPRP